MCFFLQLLYLDCKHFKEKVYGSKHYWRKTIVPVFDRYTKIRSCLRRALSVLEILNNVDEWVSLEMKSERRNESFCSVSLSFCFEVKAIIIFYLVMMMFLIFRLVNEGPKSYYYPRSFISNYYLLIHNSR